MMGDAFAGMGVEGLKLFKDGRVPRSSCGDNPLPVFRSFIQKLAANNDEARKWLEEQYNQHPTDPDLRNARNNIQRQGPTETEGDVRKNFETFLGDSEPHQVKKCFNSLRFAKNPTVFALIDEKLRNNQGDKCVVKILDLLKGFESRHRIHVSRCILEYWGIFFTANRERCVEVLSAHGIPNTALKNDALQILGTELSKQDSKIIRQGIDRLLM